MPNFSFKGTNRRGEQVSGERVADSKQALAMALRREQIFLMDAQEKKGRQLVELRVWRESQRQRHRGFHAAVFGHDRFGCATGAVP